MPRPALSDAQIDDLVKRYCEGVPPRVLTTQFDIARTTLHRHLRARGVPAHTPRPAPQGLVESYRAGRSVKALAEENGVDRLVVNRWLREAGVERRGRSAAMFTRMAQTSPQERAQLALAANEARRSQGGPSEDEQARKALAWQESRARIGDGEQRVADALCARGFTVIQQQAVGPYNIDIAVAPVAVEVHKATSHPMRQARLRQRTHDLADRGWSTLYVWLSRMHRSGVVITDECVDVIAAHIERAQANPASLCQYRVIRSTGEDAP